MTPNVILLSIDSLRADHVGCYGYGRETTPNIDRLAREGTMFRQAISHGGGTPEAFPAILGGAMPPLRAKELYIPIRTAPALAEALQNVGYRTFGMHSNPFLSRACGYGRGFEVFEDGMGRHGTLAGRQMLEGAGLVGRFLFQLGILLGGPPIIAAKGLVDRALARVRGEPFHLWLHFMDTHLPYMPGPKWQRLFGTSVSRARMLRLYLRLRRSRAVGGKDVQLLRDLYDACIRMVDDAIGVLVEALGPARARTIIAVVGDHGDAFGEHGEFGHYLSLYEELIHVPLVLNGPGVPRSVIRHVVGLEDLPATLLRLAGHDPWLPGGDLFSPRARPVISVALEPRSRRRSIACRTDRWKYLQIERPVGSVERSELYDLHADPTETRSVGEVAVETCRVMQQYVEEFLLRAKQRDREIVRIRKQVQLLRESQGRSLHMLTDAEGRNDSGL